MRGPVWRAFTVATYAFVSQLFLQAAAFVMVGALALLTVRDPSSLLLAAVAVFYGAVGAYALRHALRAISGLPPLR